MCIFTLETIVQSAGAVEADRHLTGYKCDSSSEPFGVVLVGGEAVIKDVDDVSKVLWCGCVHQRLLPPLETRS